MADRRMLAKTIIESDHFAEMPAETQMLYVRLNLAADDDGFVSNPRQIMKSCGAGDDSMKMLIAKKFVLAFSYNDNFVYLIKHWKVHNYLRSDRYKASAFRALLREVYYDENKAYSLTPGEGKTPVLPHANGIPTVDERYTDGIPSDNQSDTNGIPTVDPGKDRIGKSKDRVSLEEGEDRKGESERETQLDLLSADERKEKIKFWRGRIDFMRSQNFDAGGMYDLAKAKDGITMEEIDSYREENTDG